MNAEEREALVKLSTVLLRMSRSSRLIRVYWGFYDCKGCNSSFKAEGTDVDELVCDFCCEDLMEREEEEEEEEEESEEVKGRMERLSKGDGRSDDDESVVEREPR